MSNIILLLGCFLSLTALCTSAKTGYADDAKWMEEMLDGELQRWKDLPGGPDPVQMQEVWEGEQYDVKDESEGSDESYEPEYFDDYEELNNDEAEVAEAEKLRIQEIAEKAMKENIGLGYNLVKGNPDGTPENGGGIDPGIRKTYKILNTDDATIVEVTPHTHCTWADQEFVQVYSGTKSYQQTLDADVAVEGIVALHACMCLFSNSSNL